MVLSGAHHLSNNSEKIDALNIFPVPDGDTGTNMNLSMTSGVKEVENINSNRMNKVTEAFAKGLLMGARGKSGVILSQPFRGLSNGLIDHETVTTNQMEHAFGMGVKTTNKAGKNTK